MKSTFSVLATMFAVLAAVGGCRPQPVRPPDTTGLPSSAEALELIRKATEQRRSMRSMGRVTYFGEQGRVRLNAVLLVDRPGSFRVETLSPLEQPIDVMVSNGQRLFLLSGEKLKEGPATPENVSRLIPLTLWPEELVDLMLGGLPRTERYQAGVLAWADEDREAWRLHLDGPDGRRLEVLVDPEHHAVLSSVLRAADGSVEIEVRYDDFAAPDAGPGRLPRKIVFEMPARELEVTIKLREVEVNVDIEPTLFTLRAPPGVSVEPMDSPPILLPPPEREEAARE